MQFVQDMYIFTEEMLVNYISMHMFTKIYKKTQIDYKLLVSVNSTKATPKLLVT